LDAAAHLKSEKTKWQQKWPGFQVFKAKKHSILLSQFKLMTKTWDRL
jgi:hypothetical protein